MILEWDGTVYQMEGRKARITLNDGSVVEGFGRAVADASTDEVDLDGIVFERNDKDYPVMYTAADIADVEFIG